MLDKLVTRVLVVVPPLLLVVWMLFIFVHRDTGLEWIAWVRDLSLAGFLCMPLVYLLIRPALTIEVINLGWRFLTKTRRFPGTIENEPQPLINKTQWEQLSGFEKAFFLFCACLGALLGGYIAYQTIGGMFAP